MGTVDLVDLRKSYGLIEIMHGIDITIALDEFHGCPYQGPGGGPGKGRNHIGLAEEHVGDRQGTDRDRLASGTSEAFGAGKAVGTVVQVEPAGSQAHILVDLRDGPLS